MPGLHTFRVTNAGMQVFPRIPEQQRLRAAREDRRLATGVPGLDEMTGGGIPAGDVVLITGPAGSGKTTFATQFLAQGLADGENCVIAVFEESRRISRARQDPSGDLDEMSSGTVGDHYLRPLDLSVDEMLAEIQSAVGALGRRASSSIRCRVRGRARTDVPRGLPRIAYRLVGALTATGVTVLMTDEIVDAYPERALPRSASRSSPTTSSFSATSRSTAGSRRFCPSSRCAGAATRPISGRID